MAEVIEVNDPHELTAHRLAASALLAETPRASFHHTLDWLDVYWRHYGEGQRLRAIVVRAADKTIGILPLVVANRGSSLGDIRLLTCPMDGCGHWFGPLGSNQTATMTLAMRHLAATERDWDLLDLRCVDHEGRDHGRVLRAMRLAGMPPILSPDKTMSEIDFTGCVSGYAARLSERTQHRVRQARQQLAGMGRVEFVRHRPMPYRDGDGDPAWGLYDECEAILQPAHHGHKENLAYRRDLYAAAARLGMIDLCVLRVDGQVVAYACNLHSHGRVVSAWTGVSASVERSISEATLLSHLIEDSAVRGDRTFGLSGVDPLTRHRLRMRCERSWRLVHASKRSWRGRAVRLSRLFKPGAA